MAIAGGMTTAYLCRLVDGNLKADNTTRPRELCITPQAAVVKIMSGLSACVAGSDMVELRKLLSEAQNES